MAAYRVLKKILLFPHLQNFFKIFFLFKYSLILLMDFLFYFIFLY